VQAQFSAKVYHDGGTSNEWPGKMIKTSDGNVAMCGYADSTKPILRLDENMVLAPDPTAVVAQMNTHVMKMTQDGQTLWKTVLWDSPPRMAVNSQMCAKSIAELSDGGFVVTGWLREGVILRKNLTDPNKIQYPVDPGQTLAFVSRLDANGKELWRRFILPHPMLYSEYATRASGADIVVRRGNPDEIVIVGVAELLEEWPNFSKTAKQMQLPAALEKSYLSCFQTQWKTTRLSGKYVWLAVLREKDDKVINPCKGQPNPTNENPPPKEIDMKVPEMVYCRQYFPSANTNGRIQLDYKFRFDLSAGQNESELTSTMNNGVFQDHAFASITETPGDASDDGYAICVNAVASEAIKKMGYSRQVLPFSRWIDWEARSGGICSGIL
jgi:hypothetical protein